MDFYTYIQLELHKMKTYETYTPLIVRMSVGFCGSDAYDILLAEPGESREFVEGIAWQMGLEHARAYDVYPAEDMPDDYDEDSDGDEYSDNIDGYIVGEYTEKNADYWDGERTGGGSFVEDFIQEYTLRGVVAPEWMLKHLGSLA